MNAITVQSSVNAPLSKVWACFTEPEHITGWNFASPDWHCPDAKNNLTVGGEFHYTMAAKDGSFSFDFWGIFQSIEIEKNLEIILGDGRKMSVTFQAIEGATVVTETFEAEKVNPVEMQKAGWQAILNNFKNYTES